MDIYGYNLQRFGNPMGLQPPVNPFDKSMGGVALGGFGQPLPGIGAGQGGAQHALPSFQTFAPTPLLAQQPQGPPPPDPNGGILGAIDRVFGGPDMENLSPKARRQVRRQGLLTMAAQMLTATDPRGRRAQGLAPLGQAIFAGQQAYGQGIQGAQQAAMEQQRNEMYSQLAPRPGESSEARYNRYLDMFNAAFQSGDTEGMKFITQALNTMPKPGDSKAEPLKPPVVRIDPTGKEYFLREPDAQHPYWWKDYTGAEAPPRATAGGAGGPGKLNAVQAKAKSFQESANSAIEDINTVLGSIDPAGKWKAASGPGALGQLIRAGDPNAQLLEGASGLLAEVWLRMTTGAAYNEQEYQNAQNRYLIYPTDSKRMIEWKLNNMKLLQGMLKDIAGASNDTGTESPSDPFSSMDRAAEAE